MSALIVIPKDVRLNYTDKRVQTLWKLAEDLHNYGRSKMEIVDAVHKINESNFATPLSFPELFFLFAEFDQQTATVHGVPVVLIDPPSEEIQKLVEGGSGRHFKLVPVN